MKRLVLCLTMLSTVAIAKEPKNTTHDDPLMVSGASVSVAKRVCAIHPDAVVWIYSVIGREWYQTSCPAIAEVLKVVTPDAIDLLTYVNDVFPKGSTK